MIDRIATRGPGSSTHRRASTWRAPLERWLAGPLRSPWHAHAAPRDRPTLHDPSRAVWAPTSLITPEGDEVIVSASAEDGITLWRHDTLAPHATLRTEHAYAPWRALAASPSHPALAALGGSGELLWFDLERRQSTRARLEPGHPCSLHVDETGGWVATTLIHPRAPSCHVWRVGANATLTPHLRLLDTRHVPCPITPLREGIADLFVDHARDRLYLYLSGRPPASAEARWPGWRATVCGYELASGKLSWYAHIDAHITGDDRPLSWLTDEAGVATSLSYDAPTETLWLGSAAGVIVALDARDGALRAILAGAGTQSVTRLLWPEDDDDTVWAVTDRGDLTARCTR